MAIGDTIIAMSSVADGAFLDIRPGSGAEWIIHNLFSPDGSDIELHVYNGTNTILLDSHDGGYLNCRLHPTNSIYYRIKNTSGVAIYIGYDGVVSK